MTRQWRGPLGGLVTFLVVTALVVGGLGWVTVAALRVEDAQREAANQADLANNLRVALWRLDGGMFPMLGLEDSRPYEHYTAVWAPFTNAIANGSDAALVANFRVPSPLISARLPEWMTLHFQIDSRTGWESPQVLPADIKSLLMENGSGLTVANATPDRAKALDELRTQFRIADVTAVLAARESATPSDSPPLAVNCLWQEMPTVNPEPIVGQQTRPVIPNGFPTATPDTHPQSSASPKTESSPSNDGILRLWGFPLIAAGASSKVPSPPAAPPVQAAPVIPPLANNNPTQSYRFNGKQIRDAAGNNEYTNRAQIMSQSLNEQKSAYEGNYLTKNSFNNGTANVNPGTAVPGLSGTSPFYALPMGPNAGVQTGPLYGGGILPTPRTPADADKALALGSNLSRAATSKAGAIPATTPLDPSTAQNAPQQVSSLPLPSESTRKKTELAFETKAALKRGEAEPKSDERSKVTEQSVASRGTVSSSNLRVLSTGTTAPGSPIPPPIAVHVGAMRTHWLKGADGSERLALIRTTRQDNRVVYQGVLLDWLKLREELLDKVRDLFPEAKLDPIRDAAGVSPERAMTALPVQLNPGMVAGPLPDRWSPLRFGLVLAWVAALIALVAVGLGGWSLIDLSERRIRFVSAVTHELRTPLTSLRLYLDLLTSGMVTDEDKRKEYLTTLNTESDRLHRLIDNVLDFARLENRPTRADRRTVSIAALLEQIREVWRDRCSADGRELIVISTLPPETHVTTDSQLLQQIVGNLIDNAKKYSREAADNRIWLRAKPDGAGKVLIEVEDRGPGISPRERASVFRPFRRGASADTTAGGAGLGLALARQWAEALGGRLSYHSAEGGVGACFRLQLPVSCFSVSDK